MQLVKIFFCHKINYIGGLIYVPILMMIGSLNYFYMQLKLEFPTFSKHRTQVKKGLLRLYLRSDIHFKSLLSLWLE